MPFDTARAGCAAHPSGLEAAVRAYLAARSGRLLTPEQWTQIVGLCALLNHVDGVIDYDEQEGLLIRPRDWQVDRRASIFRCAPETVATALGMSRLQPRHC